MNNKISKIENQKNNNERVNIYIDGEYAFSCSLEIVIKNKLSIDNFVDSIKLKNIIEEDNYLKCKGYAFRVIERGAKSEKDMRSKLQDKGYDCMICDKVIKLLKEYGFIDDEKLSDSYISQKLKSEGSNKIKTYLYKKGIPEDIIKEKIFNINEEMEEETAFNLAVKKYNILIKTEKDTRKLYKKIGDYLLRKGYSYEISKRVLNNILNNPNNEDY